MKYSKINIIGKLQQWMDGEKGQTFLNYAYSWGASIVILGTLFKLTHMPSANFWLFLGMGTEVVVFFISAFDRPFEKVKEEESKNEGENIPGMSPEIEALAQRIGLMPDTEDNKMLKDVFNSIYDVYKQQLLKLHSQLESIDRMDEQLKIQTAYICEMNNIYSRILEALKVK